VVFFLPLSVMLIVVLPYVIAVRHMRKVRDIEAFSLTMAHALRAGTPLHEAAAAMATEVHGKFAEMLNRLASGLASGIRLSPLLVGNPKYFSSAYVAMVEAGERTGRLSAALERSGGFLSQLRAYKSRFIFGSVYPIFVASVCFFLLLSMALLVIPKMGEIASDYGAELPAVYEWLPPDTAVMLMAVYVLFLIAVAVCVYLSENGRAPLLSHRTLWEKIVDGVTWRTPVYRTYQRNAGLFLFARVAESVLAAGGDFSDVQHLAINYWLEKKIERVKVLIAEGTPVTAAFERIRGFPRDFLLLVRQAELSQDWPEAFRRIGDLYEEKVKKAIEYTLKVFTPLAILVNGAAVFLVEYYVFGTLIGLLNHLNALAGA